MLRKVVCFVFLMTVCSTYVFSQTEKSNERIVKDNMLFYLHQVDKGQTLYGLSRTYNVSVDDIKTYNPSVEQGLKIGEYLYIPVSKQKVEIHLVQKGETLYMIARKRGVKENDILNLNPELTETLSIGQEIIVPIGKIQTVEEEVTGTIKPSVTEDLTKKQKKALKEEQEKKIAETVKTAELKDIKHDSLFHIVEKGETLYGISRKYEVNVEEIKKANPNMSETLSVGQRIYIPVAETDTDELFTEDNSKQEIKKGVKKSEYTVYLLMPLRLSQAENIEPLKIRTLADYNSVKSFSFVQFYEAMLLAIDDITMKYPQIKIHLYVEDIETSTQVAQLLKSGKLDEADMIIGPFQGKEFSELCQYAKNKNILLINPFSSTFESYNAITYKATTINTYFGESFAIYILEKYPNANIIFASYQSENERKQIEAYRTGMRKVFNSFGKSINIQEVNMKSGGISGIKSALSNMGENFLFTFFEGEVTITNFTQSLYATNIENLTLIAPEKWLDYDNIETEYFMKLKTHYISQYFVNYSNPKVIRFIDAFRNAYNTEPTLELFAFQGYDFTYYFLSKLCETGTSFQSYDNNDNLLSTKFRFIPSPTNKNVLENTFTNIFKLKNYRFIDAFSDNEANTTKSKK